MSNEIAPKSTQTFDVAAPCEFDGPSGFEGVSQECITIPFLKIAQKSTDEANSDDPKAIAGLSFGGFFCPATRKAYGKTVQIIILKFYRQTCIYESKEPDSKFLGTMTPEDFAKMEGRCVRERSFYLDEEGKRYVDTRNFIILLADHIEDGPMLMSMSSTGIGPSKKLLTMATNVRAGDGRQAPIWSSVWQLTTGMEKSNDYTYYQITDILRLGYVPQARAKLVVNAFLDAQGTKAEALEASMAKAHEDKPAEEASHVVQPKAEAPKKSGPAAVAAAFGGKDDEQMF